MARVKEFDEVKALEKAMHLFWNHGYDGTSLQMLEKAMGLVRTSIYNTYGNKRKLFNTVISHYEKTVIAQLMMSVEKESDIRKSMAKMLNGEINLHFNKNLFEKSSKFLRRLTTDFNTIKISKKLSKFYLSDFSVFISELTKQKIKLSLIEKDEWQEHFDSYKNQILDLSNEIKIIDDEIDSLVFKIYGLKKVIKCSE